MWNPRFVDHFLGDISPILGMDLSIAFSKGDPSAILRALTQKKHQQLHHVVTTAGHPTFRGLISLRGVGHFLLQFGGTHGRLTHKSINWQKSLEMNVDDVDDVDGPHDIAAQL